MLFEPEDGTSGFSLCCSHLHPIKAQYTNCICMHARTHARTHACMHACMHAGRQAGMHACMHACMHAGMHACMHACVRACVRACMHAYVLLARTHQEATLYVFPSPTLVSRSRSAHWAGPIGPGPSCRAPCAGPISRLGSYVLLKFFSGIWSPEKIGHATKMRSASLSLMHRLSCRDHCSETAS